MKINLLFGSVIISICTMLMSGITYAQPNQEIETPPTATESIVDCAEFPGSDDCLQNPIEPDNIFEIIDTLVTGAIGILIPLSILMIIYGGLQFIFARGNDTKISAAKKTFTNIVIGVIFIVGATVLIKIVTQVLLEL